MKVRKIIHTTYNQYLNFIENEFKSIHASWQIIDKEEIIGNQRICFYVLRHEFNYATYLSIIEKESDIEIVMFYGSNLLLEEKRPFNKLVKRIIDKYEEINNG